MATRSKVGVQFDPARVEESKARYRALIRGEKIGRMALIFTPVGFEQKIGGRRDIMALDDEQALAYQAAHMNHILSQFPQGDFLPAFTTVELGQAIVPSLFGLEVIVDEKQPPYTRGRLIQDIEKDLSKLPKRIDPDVDGWGPRLRARVQRFIEATDGQVPVIVADHQSPYGVATKLMDNEALMLAMYDAPDLVRELMDIATNAIIDLIRAMQRWAGDPDLIALNDRMPFKGTGLIIWDDYVSVLSPALHAEFCRPYNLRLYEEFGFGHLHTCGPYFPSYVDAVFGHEGIASIDVSAYMRGFSRTREDMLELRRLTRERGLILHARGLQAWHHVNNGKPIEPDKEFTRKMAQGGLIWRAGGSREQGLEYLKWAEEFARQ